MMNIDTWMRNNVSKVEVSVKTEQTEPNATPQSTFTNNYTPTGNTNEEWRKVRNEDDNILWTHEEDKAQSASNHSIALIDT